MANLKSELDLTCPCCGATMVVDLNLRRIVSHKEPERADKPELSDAQRILAAEAARREALFEASFHNERTKGDALSRRFEEALKQAGQEPITKPTRDFDLD
jgi:predicted amidophosphoribosyltransferase